MKNRRNFASSLLMACGLAVLAAPAMAHQGDCGPMSGWDHMRGQRSERMQQHQKRLHDALKLTPDQESAWSKFTASMQPLSPAERGTPEDWAKLTAPERADKMLELSKRHQERMAQHVVALKDFYAALTPEQKKTFDQFHAGPRGGWRGPRQPDDTQAKPAGKG